MAYIPDDVVKLILKLLDRKTAAVCRFTCRKWSRFIKPMLMVDCTDYVDSLKMLKWAKSNGAPWGGRVYLYVPANLEIISWIHEKGYKGIPDKDLLLRCIAEGDVSLVKYLISIGCPYDIDSSAYAAYYGHLEILQYLRERNCPWDKTITKVAEEQEHYHILIWAIDNGCPHNCKPQTIKIL